jgi:subtilase family serine protease
VVHRWSRFAVVVCALALLVVPVAAQGANGHASYRAVCPGPPAGYTHCHVLVTTDAHGNPLASSSPTGLDPSTIRSVYGFPGASTAGAGTTIAIVDAYDDPNAESDLNVFSGQYGLPACTTASGCFQKVDQAGGASYPRTNAGWALEISLDVQWAHAIAPGARILLVEASSNSFTDLLAAEDYAAAHAQYVSNSWGGSESSGESSYDSHFSRAGTSFFVSAGDAGLPAEYPSASPNVISVGGTTLHFDASGAFTGESGWSSGGGGCSGYEPASPAQAAFSGYGQAGCGGSRATPDVSLDADPASGVSVYDSVKDQGQSGWFTVGGTSASSPMWAAASADTGAPVNATTVYGGTISFRDITSGNNGAPCLVGYDLCTGRGSWLFNGQTSTQPTLSIQGGGQTLTAGQTSAPMTVSISAAPSSDLTVTLASTSQAGSFSPPSVTIPAGQTSGTFTYTDSSTGTPTLTASADGATSASTTLTITPAGVSAMSVTVSAGAVSQKGPNHRVPLTVGAADSSGAPIGGASVTLEVYPGSTCAGTPAASGTGTTGSNGQVGFNFSTRQTGAWCALATVDATGYSTGSGTTTFST